MSRLSTRDYVGDVPRIEKNDETTKRHHNRMTILLQPAKDLSAANDPLRVVDKEANRHFVKALELPIPLVDEDEGFAFCDLGGDAHEIVGSDISVAEPLAAVVVPAGFVEVRTLLRGVQTERVIATNFFEHLLRELGHDAWLSALSGR